MLSGAQRVGRHPPGMMRAFRGTAILDESDGPSLASAAAAHAGRERGREGSRMTSTTSASTGQGARTVLLTLAAGQFLMTLDSSVMNVAIATVAKDVGTTVTGIQSAITLYTLVMAMLMITGGKIGSMIGRRRAFMIGCVI